MAENQNEQLSLENLAKLVKEQGEVIAQQNKTIGTLQAATLKAEVKEVKPPSIPKKAVKVAGKEYQFNVAVFVLPGSDKKYLAEEVATDEELLKQLIAIEGQGILRELV